MGTGDPKTSAEQVVAFRFGIASADLATSNAVFQFLGGGLVGSSVKGWCGHWRSQNES